MSGTFEFKHTDTVRLCETAEGALQVIEQLRGGAKNSLPFEQLRSLINILIDQMKYPTQALQEELSVVRARLWRDSKEPTLISDLGPRQAEQIQDYGRCNQPKQPICYCSLYEETALSEVNAEIEQSYVISTFILPKETTLLHIGELDYYRRTGDLHLGSLESKNKESYEDQLNGQNSTLFSLIDGFIADEFRQPAKTNQDYKITSAFTDILFNDYPAKYPIEAIVYPSVAFQHGMNFAVTLDAYNTKLKLDSANTKIIRIKGVYGYGIFDWVEEAKLKSSNNNNGVLEWESA